MRTYFLRFICIAVACIGTFVAGTRADLVPQSAASFQVLNPTAFQGTKGGQAYRQDDGASSVGHAPIIPVSAESGHGGPTPYPKSETDWPGVGVIRVFGWMMQNRQYFWSQRPINQGAVVFVGDSLIAGWTTLRDDFAPLHVANVGIGGDVSRGVLFRLQEDVIDLNPMAVVILIGTNDMSAMEDHSLLVANLTSILRTLRDYNPVLPIVLCKLPPRNYPAAPVSTKDMLALNSRLGELSESDTKLAVLDLYQLLALPDGSIDPQNFEADKIHISPTGYKKFHDALIPIFRALRVPSGSPQ
jgi:lysophospholipase L1-like esterase